MSTPLRLAVFALVFLLLHALTSWSDGFERWFIEDLSVPLAAWLLNTSGLAAEAVSASGSRLVASGGGLNVLQGCEGLDVLALWIAAVAAGPFSWPGRLLGWTLGSLLVFALNQLRLLSLFGIYREHRAWFGDAHGLWWPLALVGAVFLLYLAWQRCFSPPQRAPAAGAA